jgi:hypothetical protein
VNTSGPSGRIAAIREAVGIAAYYCGDWAQALAEFRAARRMGSKSQLLPLIADCERGVGRPEKAIELARGPEAAELTGDDADENARFEDKLLPMDCALVLREDAPRKPRHDHVKGGPKSVALLMRCGVHGLAPLQDMTLASRKPTASASICEYRSSCRLPVGTKAATPKRTS